MADDTLRAAIERLCEAQGADSYVMVHVLRSTLRRFPDDTAHDAEVAAKALRDTATALLRTEGPGDASIARWLHARADRIEAQNG